MTTEMEKRATAKQVVEALLAEEQALQQERAAVMAGTRPAEQAVQAAEGLRSQRRGLLARMMRMGGIDTKSEEMRTLERTIAASQASAEQAEDILAAREQVLSELNSRAQELAERRAKASMALRHAQLSAATEQIKAKAIPEFLEAVDSFKNAYGRLQGMARAQIELRQELYDDGERGVQAIGSLLAPWEFWLETYMPEIPGALINGHLKVDCRQVIAETKETALREWRQ